MDGKRQPAADRQKRHRRGHAAELLAAAFLMARGHRILARRFQTGSGEIDLVTRKAGRIAFIEVKRRATRVACEASITPRLRQRVRAAANIWMAQHPEHQALPCGFDLVFVLPWRWPLYLPDTL